MDLFSCCWVARDDTVVRALASHQCGLGFKYRRQCHMWVEFVVGSLRCSERFSSVFSVFSLFSKTNISKCQFNRESGRRGTTLWMYYLQIIIYFILPCFCKEITPVPSDSLTVTVTELSRITYFALIVQLLLRGLIPIRRTCHASCGNQLCSLACGLLCGCLI